MVAAVKDFSSVIGQDTNSMLSLLVCVVCVAYFSSYLLYYNVHNLKHENNFIVLGLYIHHIQTLTFSLSSSCPHPLFILVSFTLSLIHTLAGLGRFRSTVVRFLPYRTVML